ncbi:MAG: rRNA maturation RNase YbeY [Oscillospiraceae bacterium]|nr:rRNA maturation RNase YbeY [Oscillospiraceae bacterium]
MRNRHDIFIEGNPNFKIKRLVKRIVNLVLDYERINNRCEVSVILTDNKEIRKLNKEFRDIDKTTDVLSFPMEENVLGDIVISLDKTKKQADLYGHSFERELTFLCVHGLLHLLGYDHEISKDEEKIMFDKQKEIMKLI